MKIRNEEILIEENRPFANCKLDREKYADVLTSIITKYEDGFVLAINNKWGYGKTTFLKMWNQKLLNLEFETIYFNAWENDFENNPFTAILSEINQKIGSNNQQKFQSIITKASKIITSALPSIAEHYAKKYLGTSHIGDLTKDLAESGIEIFQTEIENYISRKKSIEDFRIELEKYLTENLTKRPLVFFIDELDRCRPNYAVEVLENIKHLFSVKGIIFVISIDKEQLGHAVKGVYGSEKLNSDEYLRRFIDLEYSLPDPNIEQYCKFLFEQNAFNQIIEQSEHTSFLRFSNILFENSGLSLRQIEQIFNHMSLTVSAHTNFDRAMVILYLVYCKHVFTDIYIAIRSKSLTPQEILNNLAITINIKDLNQEFHLLFKMVSVLLYNYTNWKMGKKTIETLFNKNSPITLSDLRILPKFGLPEEKDMMFTFLQHIKINGTSSINELDYLIQKIELTEALKK